MCITEYNEELHERNIADINKEEGRREGRREGMLEGRREGEKQERIRAIIRMIELNDTKERIMLYGYTDEEITEAANYKTNKKMLENPSAV